MTINLYQILQNYPHPYLTDVELANLLDGTPDSRYGKVKRMIAQGKLIHIKRGLYYVAKDMSNYKMPCLFELAQYIYGPSFISLESALRFHNLLPEAVYTTTSMAGKRSKKFETPLGIFSYSQAPLTDLYTDVIRYKVDDQEFFIAKPWRAICDYVFCHRMNWNSIDPLIKSLRIDLDNLPILRQEEIQLLDGYYRNHRISFFLKGIQKDLVQINKWREKNHER